MWNALGAVLLVAVLYAIVYVDMREVREEEESLGKGTGPNDRDNGVRGDVRRNGYYTQTGVTKN